MQTDVLSALGLVLAAAIMNATYTLPMKLNREWKWEHSWLAFTILGVVGVPAVITMSTVPGLWSIYSRTPAPTLFAMALFGAGWGVSMIFFGLALSLVGVALTFTISLSTSAASGALLPFIGNHPERLFTAQGAVLIAGILLIFAGVALCGLAGKQRDQGTSEVPGSGRGGFVRGFLFALISGVLGSLLNLGLAYGGGIQAAARDNGASMVMTSNAVWLPCVSAGFVPGVIYCLYLMKKNGTDGGMIRHSRWYYWLSAICMGLLWYGSVLLYSLSASYLGSAGTSIGWPLFLSAIVVMSTVVGVLTGEWNVRLHGPFRTLVAGLAFLVAAITVLSIAGRMPAGT